MMRPRTLLARQAFHGDGNGAHRNTCANLNGAGWREIAENVVAAQPDLVSVDLGADLYKTGDAHPKVDSETKLIWSRRLHRFLEQSEVFATPPDRALRQIAQQIPVDASPAEAMNIHFEIVRSSECGTICREAVAG